VAAVQWLDVCNRALSRIGHELLPDLITPGQARDYCNTIHPDVRDTLLRTHDWNCATARAVLTQETWTANTDWGFRYILPKDCLKVRHLESRGDFAVEGRRLYCNEITATLVYTQRVEDPAQLDVLLLKAMVLNIAMELAPMLKSAADIPRISAEFSAIYQEAVNEDNSEKPADDSLYAQYQLDTDAHPFWTAR
jgi:hypothetical protein